MKPPKLICIKGRIERRSYYMWCPILFPTITKLRSVTAVIVTREIRWRWPINVNINSWHGIVVMSVRVAQLYNALFEFLYALRVLLRRLALQTMNLHHQLLDLSHALHQVRWCRWVWGIGWIWNDGSCWDGLWDRDRVYRVSIGVWKWLRDGHGHGHGVWVLGIWVLRIWVLGIWVLGIGGLHRYHKALRDESSIRIHYSRSLFWEGKKKKRIRSDTYVLWVKLYKLTISPSLSYPKQDNGEDDHCADTGNRDENNCHSLRGRSKSMKFVSLISQELVGITLLQCSAERPFLEVSDKSWCLTRDIM